MSKTSSKLSAETLEKHKRNLLALCSRLIRTVGHLEQAIAEDVMAAGDLSSTPIHPADIDSDGIDGNLAVAENEQQILDQVEAALAKIEDGSYGQCEECGQPIPEERLEAIPYAAMCVSCASR